jgi:hypothetical protein
VCQRFQDVSLTGRQPNMSKKGGAKAGGTKRDGGALCATSSGGSVLRRLELVSLDQENSF